MTVKSLPELDVSRCNSGNIFALLLEHEDEKQQQYLMCIVNSSDGCVEMISFSDHLYLENPVIKRDETVEFLDQPQGEVKISGLAKKITRVS